MHVLNDLAQNTMQTATSNTPPIAAKSVLYTGTVCGPLQEWMATLVFLLFLATLLLLAFWHPWSRWLWVLTLRGKPAVAPEARTASTFANSFWLAGWFTLVGYAAATWIYTVVMEPGGGIAKATIMIGFAILILGLTFLLEGLEIALTQLEDKDEQQFQGRAVDGLSRVRHIRESFFEAREWVIVLLLIAATLMIEKNEYWIPRMAHVDDVDATGKWVRVILTLVLTSFPFVWIAQSPGKYVAGRNSAAFMEYSVTSLVLQLLVLLSKFPLSKVGLDLPSERTKRLALWGMKQCATERNLPPSEFQFFADGVKKYGYGYCMAQEKLTVEADGSCTAVLRNLSYIEAPRNGILRLSSFEEGFTAETLTRLREGEDSRHWAFSIPLMGERVTDEMISQWWELMQREDPGEESVKGLVPQESGQWKVSATLVTKAATANKRMEEEVKATLDFREPLPRPNKAMLVLWEVTLRTRAGAMRLPDGSDSRPDNYHKQYKNPCLYVAVEIKLPLDSTYMFVGKRDFTVSYDGIEHARETERFRMQSSPAGVLRNMEAMNTITEFEHYKNVRIILSSPLPGAVYTIFWNIGTGYRIEKVSTAVKRPVDTPTAIEDTTVVRAIAAATQTPDQITHNHPPKFEQLQ